VIRIFTKYFIELSGLGITENPTKLLKKISSSYFFKFLRKIFSIQLWCHCFVGKL